MLAVMVMVGGVLSVGGWLVDVVPVGVGVTVDAVALLVLPVWVLVVLVESVGTVPVPVPVPVAVDPLPVDALVPLVEELPVAVLPVLVLPVLVAGGVGGMTGVSGVLRLMPMDSTLSISPPSWFKLPAASPKRSLDTNTSALVLLVLGVNKAV